MLRFSKANAKTKNLIKIAELSKYLGKGKKVYSLDLSSGVSCPGARDCKSCAVVDPLTGRATIQDGPYCQFRCFSASQEVLLPALRKLRADNFAQIKAADNRIAIRNLILNSLPSNAGIVRLHVGGDFFSLNYLRAIIDVATMRPDVLFYFYTKSLHHLKVVVNSDSLPDCDLPNGVLLSNLLVTASRGGVYDNIIDELGIREAVVVYSENEAIDSGLIIDHDDSHASLSGGSFALLVHGQQPAKSNASKALSKLKKLGLGTYTR